MWLLTIVFIVGGVAKTDVIGVTSDDDYIPHGCYNVMSDALRYAAEHNIKVLAATCGRAKEA